jgi:hypothetical protein
MLSSSPWQEWESAIGPDVHSIVLIDTTVLKIRVEYALPLAASMTQARPLQPHWLSQT